VYTPAHFNETDSAELLEFICSHPFGALITQNPEASVPAITHVPFVALCQPDGSLTLQGHVARANPHGALLASGSVSAAVFTGPHAYISPAWYTVSPAVPTWNYTAVHVTGSVRLLDLQESLLALAELTRVNEAYAQSGWSLDSLEPSYLEKMAQGTIGFELKAQRIEGKFKMSQNRSEADRQSVILHLRQRPTSDHGSQDTAEWMERTQQRRSSGK
jgi:transcriptional regulator